MKYISLCIVMIAACASETSRFLPNGPQVALRVSAVDASYLTERRAYLLQEALRNWDDVGFVAERDAMPDCAGHKDSERWDWGEDCQIIVYLRFLPTVVDSFGVAQSGISNVSARTIDLTMTDSDIHMLGAATHELGHVLLHTRRHLEPDQFGVMHEPIDSSFPTSDDFDLACLTTTRCIP